MNATEIEVPIERTCPDCGQGRHVDCYGTRAARCDYCQQKGQNK